jgi:sulfide dehydrogenase cytochrome subunit
MRLSKMLLPVIPLLLNALPSIAGNDSSRPSTAAIALACTGCHGASGQGFDSIPAITGMPEAEFLQRMKAFRDGQRRATVMDRIARGYRDEDFAALAKFYNHR